MTITEFLSKYNPEIIMVDGHLTTTDRIKYIKELSVSYKVSIVVSVQNYQSVNRYLNALVLDMQLDGQLKVVKNNYSTDKIFATKFSKKAAIEILKESI
jgi:hypothetical protein